jgi:hypothetical protein
MAATTAAVTGLPVAASYESEVMNRALGYNPFDHIRTLHNSTKRQDYIYILVHTGLAASVKKHPIKVALAVIEQFKTKTLYGLKQLHEAMCAAEGVAGADMYERSNKLEALSDEEALKLIVT